MAKQFERILSLTGADLIELLYIYTGYIMCPSGIRSTMTQCAQQFLRWEISKKIFLKQPLITYKFLIH